MGVKMLLEATDALNLAIEQLHQYSNNPTVVAATCSFIDALTRVGKSNHQYVFAPCLTMYLLLHSTTSTFTMIKV